MTAFRQRGAVTPKALGGWRHSKLDPHRVFILRRVAEKLGGSSRNGEVIGALRSYRRTREQTLLLLATERRCRASAAFPFGRNRSRAHRGRFEFDKALRMSACDCSSEMGRSLSRAVLEPSMTVAARELKQEAPITRAPAKQRLSAAALLYAADSFPPPGSRGEDRPTFLQLLARWD